MAARKKVDIAVSQKFYEAFKAYLPARRAAQLAEQKAHAALVHLRQMADEENMPKLVTLTYGKKQYEVGFTTWDTEFLADPAIMWAGTTFGVKEKKR